MAATHEQQGDPVAQGEQTACTNAAELLRLLGEVAALEQQLAALRQDVDVASNRCAQCTRAVVTVGEGIEDGAPMDWPTLERACLELAFSHLDRLRSEEALLHRCTASTPSSRRPGARC